MTTNHSIKQRTKNKGTMFGYNDASDVIGRSSNILVHEPVIDTMVTKIMDCRPCKNIMHVDSGVKGHENSYHH